MGEITIIVGESGTDMFFGQKELTIDDKSRLVLPSSYREEFTSSICYLTYSLDGAISIFPKSTFQKNVEKIVSLSDFSSSARELKRTFLSNAFEIQIDSHNRILLPKTLINKSHLEKNVVIIGLYDHLEIYDLAIYQKIEKDGETNYSKNAQRVLEGE